MTFSQGTMVTTQSKDHKILLIECLEKEITNLQEENAKLRKSLDKAEKLAEAVRCVLEDRVHNTTGIYSPKNNKCRHGNCGYEGCAWCIEEYLEKAYATYRAKTGEA